MRVDVGPLVVEVDSAGRITGAAARGRPADSFVSALELGACRVAGSEVAWASREVSRDADEVGTRRVGRELDVTLRHGFSAGWTTRLLVVNRLSATVNLERLQLIVRPATGRRLSALVAGSRLCWAVQAANGDGPLLVARLVAGSVTGVTEEGLELGPLRLLPGQRYVSQLRWELCATPRSVVAGPGREVLLSHTVYQVGESALLPGDPDAALVTSPGLTVEEAAGGETFEDGAFEVGTFEAGAGSREAYAVEPGRHRLELRSAEGDLRLELAWVRPLGEQLAVWTASVLAGPRTRAGVVSVRTLPAAIVVQAALGLGGLDDADQAADALDRLTARLVDQLGDDAGPAEPFQVLFLLGEHGRTGEEEVLAAALERQALLLAGDGPPPAGLGLGLLRSVLAGVDAPERVAPLLRLAVQRAAAADSGPAATAATAAAELELLLAVRPLLADDHPARQRLIQLVREVGASLGSGLPGRIVTPPAEADHAHLVAVLRMLPEQGLAEATRSWGAPLSLLTHRWTLEVLDRLTDTEVGSAAAWLALTQRPG